MKRLALIAIAVFLGLALWAGLTIAQQNPWWHPLNPNGQSAGVTYGTVLPTLANTGNQLTDGLLAVQLTAGSPPGMWIYDQSTAGWLRFGLMPTGGLTNNVVPRWNTAAGTFVDTTQLINAGIPAAGASGSLFEMDATLNAAGAGNIVNGLFVDLVMGVHTGGQINGVHIDGITGTAATESAVYIGAGWDRDIEFEDTAEVIYLPATFDLIMGTQAPGAQLEFTDVNAAGGGADILTIQGTLGIMDSNDTVRGLFVDLTNADHTGVNNILYGIEVDTIVQDAQANEWGIRVASGWDYSLVLEDAVTAEILFNVTGALSHIRSLGGLTLGDGSSASAISAQFNSFPDAVANYADTFMVGVGDGTDTIAAMDNNDVYAMLEIDFTNANHAGTGNVLQGIYIDTIVGDPDAYETAMRLGGGFDTHITFIETGATPPDNPPAGQVAMFVDDNADYSGGGGNDCILGMIDSAGTITIVATLILNGACP